MTLSSVKLKNRFFITLCFGSKTDSLDSKLLIFQNLYLSDEGTEKQWFEVPCYLLSTLYLSSGRIESSKELRDLDFSPFKGSKRLSLCLELATQWKQFAIFRAGSRKNRGSSIHQKSFLYLVNLKAKNDVFKSWCFIFCSCVDTTWQEL